VFLDRFATEEHRSENLNPFCRFLFFWAFAGSGATEIRISNIWRGGIWFGHTGLYHPDNATLGNRFTCRNTMVSRA
tara:strand:- start:236 stop:463 length:228 start_codon:yes stop_codon:yes gene_type:complete